MRVCIPAGLSVLRPSVSSKLPHPTSLLLRSGATFLFVLRLWAFLSVSTHCIGYTLTPSLMSSSSWVFVRTTPAWNFIHFRHSAPRVCSRAFWISGEHSEYLGFLSLSFGRGGFLAGFFRGLGPTSLTWIKPTRSVVLLSSSKR